MAEFTVLGRHSVYAIAKIRRYQAPYEYDLYKLCYRQLNLIYCLIDGPYPRLPSIRSCFYRSCQGGQYVELQVYLQVNVAEKFALSFYFPGIANQIKQCLQSLK